MPGMPGGRRAAFIAAGALTAGSLYLAGGAAADTTTVTTTYASDCFAQLVSLQLAGEDVLGELDPGSDCSADTDAFFPTDTIAGPEEFPFVVNVLYENTSRSGDQSSARARTGVAHVFLPLSVPSEGNLPDITLDVLTSESTCKNGVADGSSHVVGLNVGGEAVELPGDITGSPIDLGPLGFIELNKQARSSSSSDSGAGTNPRIQSTTNNVENTALHVVLLPADPDPPVVDLVVAHTSASCKKTTTTTTTNGGGGGGQPAKTGWMNGGGTMVDGAKTTVDPGTKVSHGFVLPCFKSQAPPPGGTNLTVNGSFGHFKLDTVDSVKCTDDPNQGDPQNPKAEFNTMDGTGTGTCNGKPAKVTWHFTDEGEPNTADEAALQIDTIGSPSVCHVTVTGVLTNGNNQAHPLPAGASKSSKSKASAKR